jgi:hypothetical protein
VSQFRDARGQFTTRRALEKAVGKALVALAAETKRLYQKEVSRPYPPASVPGEFPRKRTGKGHDGVTIGPPRETANATVIRVWHSPATWYMGFLWAKRGRKGIVDVLNKLAARAAHAVRKGGR